MKTTSQMLNELEAQGFYGTLEIKFEAGHVVLLKKTETLKPTQNYGDNRGNYERTGQNS
jgi:hypothetical protein